MRLSAIVSDFLSNGSLGGEESHSSSSSAWPHLPHEHDHSAGGASHGHAADLASFFDAPHFRRGHQQLVSSFLDSHRRRHHRGGHRFFDKVAAKVNLMQNMVVDFRRTELWHSMKHETAIKISQYSVAQLFGAGTFFGGIVLFSALKPPPPPPPAPGTEEMLKVKARRAWGKLQPPARNRILKRLPPSVLPPRSKERANGIPKRRSTAEQVDASSDELEYVLEDEEEGSLENYLLDKDGW